MRRRALSVVSAAVGGASVPFSFAAAPAAARSRALPGSPTARWAFDKRVGTVTREAMSGTIDPVDYVFHDARYEPDSDPLRRLGVRGRALYSDGYLTVVTAQGPGGLDPTDGPSRRVDRPPHVRARHRGQAGRRPGRHRGRPRPTGHPTRVHASLSHDAFATRFHSRLTHAGIDLTGSVSVLEPSVLTVANLDETGQATNTLHADSAADCQWTADERRAGLRHLARRRRAPRRRHPRSTRRPRLPRRVPRHHPHPACRRRRRR